jgi:hypothetical protein
LIVAKNGELSGCETCVLILLEIPPIRSRIWPTLVSPEAQSVIRRARPDETLFEEMDSVVFVGGVAVPIAICPTVATPSG